MPEPVVIKVRVGAVVKRFPQPILGIVNVSPAIVALDISVRVISYSHTVEGRVFVQTVDLEHAAAIE